jgi:hypothetical protein
MLEALALIIAAYAVAKLLNEYILNDPGLATARLIVAVVAIAAIVFGFLAVADKASQVSGLLG